MFHIYSRLPNKCYKVYDDEDLTLETCSTEEIREYLKMGIAIKGASSSGTTLTLSIAPPKGFHITKEKLSNGFLNGLVDDWCNKDMAKEVYKTWSNKEFFYSVRKGKNRVLALDLTKHGLDTDCKLLQVFSANKSEIQSALELVLSNFRCSTIGSYTPSFCINALEKAGCKFFYDVEEQRCHMIDNEGLYPFRYRCKDKQ